MASCEYVEKTYRMGMGYHLFQLAGACGMGKAVLGGVTSCKIVDMPTSDKGFVLTSYIAVCMRLWM